MRPYRNQMVISTKAGYDMWPGPYGDGGSRKYLISSLDESLKRMLRRWIMWIFSTTTVWIRRRRWRKR